MELTPMDEIKHKPDPRPNRLMVAFAVETVLVLDYCGPFFEWWADGDPDGMIGSTEPSVLGDHASSSPNPDYGIWVLEPEIKHHVPVDMEYGHIEDVYTLVGDWRKATPSELTRLQYGKCPWPVEQNSLTLWDMLQEESAPEEAPDHLAIVAVTCSGSLTVLETQSEYLEWILDGGGWLEADCDFYEEIGEPPERHGIWVLEFEVDGTNWHDPETGHPEAETWAVLKEWRRPTESEYETIITGKSVLTNDKE